MLPEPSHRFENFVVGSGNRLAVAAARAVAEAPGAVYNPLFIYSASGLGKTHLVGAIGNMARHIEGNLGVEYLTLEDFVDQLHAAVASGGLDRFKEKFSRADMLILDDVQFLTGRRETQSELLRLFAAWQRGGKQLIMTSDRPPADIADVDERLVTRLTGGLIVDIGPPEYETRLAILRRKCEERQLEFAPGILEELAKLEFTNVRELQGALNRLAVHIVAGQGTLEPGKVRQVLGLVVRATPTREAALLTDSEFESFISDVASVLAEQVAEWRVKLGESISKWKNEGFRTDSLEELLTHKDPSQVDAALASFEDRVRELRELERRACEVDARSAGREIFRDVSALEQARDYVEKLLVGSNPPPRPSAELTRDSFDVGPSNELAVRVSDMVVAQPGSKYNPLFIHGPAGVGRTHLINAVGNELLNMSGGATQVVLVSGQAFIDELVAALQTGDVESFRARYRTADALIVDDVHFICGKQRSQEELFHLFNSMHAAGRQIVLASDRHPKDMDGLEDRLRSRFEGGVVVGMAPPDRILREKLLTRHLGHDASEDGGKLMSWLADRPSDSAREVIETAYRLRAAADAAGLPLSIDFARNELGRTTPVRASRRSTPAERLDTFFTDEEKVVWDWPDVSSRLIEILR